MASKSIINSINLSTLALGTKFIFSPSNAICHFSFYTCTSSPFFPSFLLPHLLLLFFLSSLPSLLPLLSHYIICTSVTQGLQETKKALISVIVELKVL